MRRLARDLFLVRKAFDNWPVVALAGTLWKHLPLPRSELVVKSRRGARLTVPLTREAGALYPALEIFAFSVYEAGWKLEDRPYSVDIGANVGAFTLWLRETYPGLRGICYEPDPEAFSYLERNLKGSEIRARNAAVAERSGTAVLSRPSPCGGTSSLGIQKERLRGSDVQVPVVAFDEVMAKVEEPVSLVKLDCEGSEYEIVLESQPESWQAVRRVVIEYHPSGDVEPIALVRRLRLLGFSLVKERQDAVGLGMYWFSRDGSLEAT